MTATATEPCRPSLWPECMAAALYGLELLKAPPSLNGGPVTLAGRSPPVKDAKATGWRHGGYSSPSNTHRGAPPRTPCQQAAVPESCETQRQRPSWHGAGGASARNDVVQKKAQAAIAVQTDEEVTTVDALASNAWTADLLIHSRGPQKHPPRVKPVVKTTVMPAVLAASAAQRRAADILSELHKRTIFSTLHAGANLPPSDIREPMNLKVTIVSIAGLRCSDRKPSPSCVCQCEIVGKTGSKQEVETSSWGTASEWDAVLSMEGFVAGEELLFTILEKSADQTTQVLGSAVILKSLFAASGSFGGHLTLRSPEKERPLLAKLHSESKRWSREIRPGQLPAAPGADSPTLPSTRARGTNATATPIPTLTVRTEPKPQGSRHFSGLL